MSPTARVARGATYLFIQGLFNSVLGVIYFIFLARAVSDRPEEMGVFAILVFVLSLPPVLGTFALPSAAVKYISQYIAENDAEKARSVVVRTLQIGVLSSSIVFVLLFAPAEWLSSVMFNTSDYAPLLRIVALASVFNILYVLVSAFLQGLQKIDLVAWIGILYTLVQNSVGISLILLGWRLYGVVISWFSAFLIASAAGLIMTSRHLGILGKSHPIGSLFKFSRPLYVSSAVGNFVGWVDQLLLVSYMGFLYGVVEAQRLLGVYYVAVRASIVPSLFSSSIVTALFPQLSELYARQGANGLKDAFRVSTRYSVLIGLPLIVGLATLAYPVIIVFAGWQYIEATEPLIIISIAAAIGTLGVAAGPIMMALARTGIVSVISVISVILSFLFSYLALAALNLGMVGTAWARTFAAIIGLALSLYALSRYVSVSFDKEAIWKASAASALLVFSIFALDFVRKLFSPASYQFLVIRLHLLPVYVIVGGLAYFLGLVLLRAIKKRDIELIEEYLPRRLRRIAGLMEKIAV